MGYHSAWFRSDLSSLELFNEVNVVRYGPWHEYFAWTPVRVNDSWVWLKKVYRRCSIIEWNNQYGVEYGTLFDVIGSTKKNIES